VVPSGGSGSGWARAPFVGGGGGSSSGSSIGGEVRGVQRRDIDSIGWAGGSGLTRAIPSLVVLTDPYTHTAAGGPSGVGRGVPPRAADAGARRLADAVQGLL